MFDTVISSILSIIAICVSVLSVYYVNRQCKEMKRSNDLHEQDMRLHRDDMDLQQSVLIKQEAIYFLRKYGVDSSDNELYLLPLCALVANCNIGYVFNRKIYREFKLLSQGARTDVLASCGVSAFGFEGLNIFEKSVTKLHEFAKYYYPSERFMFLNVNSLRHGLNEYGNLPLTDVDKMLGWVKRSISECSFENLESAVSVSFFRNSSMYEKDRPTLFCLECLEFLHLVYRAIGSDIEFSWEKACIGVSQLYVEDLFLWALYGAAFCAGCYPRFKEVKLVCNHVD